MVSCMRGMLGPSLPHGLATWGPFVLTLPRHVESGCGRKGVGDGPQTTKGPLCTDAVKNVCSSQRRSSKHSSTLFRVWWTLPKSSYFPSCGPLRTRKQALSQGCRLPTCVALCLHSWVPALGTGPASATEALKGGTSPTCCPCSLPTCRFCSSSALFPIRIFWTPSGAY